MLREYYLCLEWAYGAPHGRCAARFRLAGKPKRQVVEPAHSTHTTLASQQLPLLRGLHKPNFFEPAFSLSVGRYSSTSSLP